jgi:hypothetical protein
MLLAKGPNPNAALAHATDMTTAMRVVRVRTIYNASRFSPFPLKFAKLVSAKRPCNRKKQTRAG